MAIRKIINALKDWRNNIDFITSYLMSIIQILSNGFSLLLITSIAGVEVYGGYMLLRSIGGVLVGFLSFRTSEVIVKFSSVAKDVLFGLRRTLGISLTLDTVLAFCIAYVGVNVDYFIEFFEYSGGIEAESFTLYFLGISASVYLSSIFGVFQSIHRVYIINLLKITQSVIFTSYIMFFSFISDLTLYSVVTSVFYANIITVVISIIFLVTRLCKVQYLKKDAKVKESMLKYLFSTFFSASFKGVNQNIDVLLISAVLDEAQLGLYGVIKQFMLPVQKFVEPYSVVLFPKFVKCYSETSLMDLKKKVFSENKKLLLNSAYISIFCMSLVYLYIFFFLNRESFTVYTLAIIGIDLYIKVNLWWCRPYSNTVNPYLTLLANSLTLAVLLILFAYQHTFFVQYWLFELMLLTSIIMFLAWNSIFRKIKND